MKDREQQVAVMQKALEEYKTNGFKAKLYFSSMKEISTWLQEQAKKLHS